MEVEHYEEGRKRDLEKGERERGKEGLKGR